ncbi:kinase-like domain-containing protein, partial [Mycena filopes]
DQENFWVECQPFLLDHGYQLRPRYRQDWVPSWGTDQYSNRNYEDDLMVYWDRVLDATSIRDGKKVILKYVPTDGRESTIIRQLSSPELRSDPRNRTIPLLDIFPMPDSPWTFLVLPYCREFTYPPFHCRNEFVDAMSQFMEGLQFMHDHNIAHFDIAPQNMVMDEQRVIPNGSHFSRPWTHTGFWGLFSWKDRCTVAPVDYYYIDFGLSSYHPAGNDAAVRVGTLRTFPTIPELSQTVPYNPFKVDIFQLGLTIHKLIDEYFGLEDFRPVADAMTVADPRLRPEPAEALAHLRGIAAAIT